MKYKALKITSIFVLLAALGGYWGYSQFFKPDPEIKQQLNNQFGEGFFSFEEENDVDDLKPVGSGETDNNSKSDDIKNSIDLPKTEAKEPSEVKTETTSSPVNKDTLLKPTQEEIKAKYTPRFIHLQNVAMSRLDTLYSAAIQEYAQQKKAGTVNRSALAQKYIQAGNMLEASMDSQFNSTLNEMKVELTDNNLSTDIVNVIKNEYESAKSRKRSQLLSKIR